MSTTELAEHDPPPENSMVRAGRALSERARDFAQWARKIAGEEGLPAGGVHDARVAGRRLAASLRLLEPFLPINGRKLRRRVSCAARALGAFRDSDILAEILAPYSPGNPESIGREIAALSARRGIIETQSRRQFLEIVRGRVLDRLDAIASPEFPAACAKRVRFVPPEYPAFHASRQAGTFFCLAAALKRGAHDDEFHRLRIAGKRARYTLEIILPENNARNMLLDSFKRLQDALGDIHDYHVAIDRMAELAKSEGMKMSVYQPVNDVGTEKAQKQFLDVHDSLVLAHGRLRARFFKRWPPPRFARLRARIDQELRSANNNA
ncbi:MAG: CHAD domain-containing protein [bacterium]